MRLVALILALLFAAPLARAEGFVIGLAAPLSGPYAIIGEQMRQGAAAALANSGAELVIVDDACTAASGEAAAARLIAREVAVAVGFVCTESVEAALPALTEAGIPVISPVIRTVSLTDRRQRTGWPFFRLAPRGDAEHAAVARILIPRWRGDLYALIDDGTIYGRELIESFRLEAETAGLSAVFIDTYRPQMENQVALVGRLARSGATHVLVGGDREDVAIMARDAAEMGHDLVLAGGEALRAAPGEVPLAEGVLMVAPPEWSERAADATIQALRDAGIEPDGYVLPAHAAMEIAVIAAAAAEDGSELVADVLSARAFPTVIGTVAFDAQGDLADFAYRLYRHDGRQFLPVE
ncbi:ABC transporter substrate-binding protein [Chelativorans sp. ZYF759]|uniref:branched-chain amino acid ABC transporter substrate-binding protein n=1 Tax=Chelativorans sp. ZYF759 TaxID=2692213 RepID=UPI00145ED8CF|nr:branched-chain amino acid ABC transporter substrate-binding protein [Chelativorans sp. ZYF759]NMG38605.1 ABC transporter substrate-binding protein [Chelativorans sp. ZYF759]